MRKDRIVRAVVTATAGMAVAATAPSAAAGSVLDRSGVQATWMCSRIAVHFDLAAGQMPENIALAPDGIAYVTFAAARQVASVDPRGTTRVLATLPVPADGGANTPVLKFALTTGIVRTDDGVLYFLYASGDAASTGLYRLRPGRTPQRIAALPANGLPNGLALDTRTNAFYITDSVLGTVFTVPLGGGRPTAWSSAPELASTGFLGANGIKVRRDAVWVSNLDKGTLLRIPLRNGHPGDVEVKASGLNGADDFAFAGDDVLVTLNGPNSVVRVSRDGVATTVLTGADGLQNPTSVAVRGTVLYVLSAAYSTAQDPNLILAPLPRH